MIMFYVTFPDESEANRISQHLISNKIVACSNIHPIKSCYHWQKKIENDSEFVAIYKTSYANVALVEKVVEELHPYEIPCILHWEFSCNLSYEKWLRKNIIEK